MLNDFHRRAFFVTFLAALVTACGVSQPTSTLSQTVEALPIERALHLSDYQGMTFFDVMTMSGGIRDNLDEDAQSEFRVADVDNVLAARQKFSPKVNRKLLSPFGSRALSGFVDLVESLEGKTYTPTTIKSAISRKGYVPWTIADFLSMASGASTLVYLDENNYYYNVSYEADNLKSGRSFGAGPKHKADDASYPFYLNELANHLQYAQDAMPFYEALLEVIAESDTSSLQGLDPYAQTLLTDFVTIYTAELYRHLNAGLEGRAPWENDLAEVTLLSLWNHSVGKVQKDGKLVDGTPRDWNGVGETGSGVGITRRDRRSLQVKVCNAVRELEGELVRAFERHLHRRRDDCYRSIMEFLNNHDTQDSVAESAQSLTKAVLAFLAYTRDHADEILRAIEQSE